ncbi:ficolin-2-like [Physella acuta]|uniref:ficolin-2-like n=1 Tax=Physella acuta TaxID=109671 RepID=UPI0027DC5576|nr:ficolin-2-like [Physella acuta]
MRTAIILFFTFQVASLNIMTSVYHSYNQSEFLMLPLGKKFTCKNLANCASQCLATNTTCFSFAYNKINRTCSLGSWLVPYNNTMTSDTTKIYSNGILCNSSSGVNLTMTSPCPDNHVNIGNNPTFDPFNLNVYKSCRDVISNEPRKVVTLTSGLVGMCDTVTDGGGWTIFQRRVSGTVDFYRGWEEYKHGFGDYGIGEFYLGNENLFRLTSKVAHELRVDLVYNGNYYAKYSRFKLSNESEGYKLSIFNYTGTAGDSLGLHNNHMFTTYDRDNDDGPGNCAEVFLGAWWYVACHESNLNAQFGSSSYAIGLNWYLLTGLYNSVQFTEMKMRPIVLAP